MPIILRSFAGAILALFLATSGLHAEPVALDDRARALARMEQALMRYDIIARRTEFQYVVMPKPVAPGESDSAIPSLRYRLAQEEFYNFQFSDNYNQIYDAVLQQAVMNFQAANGLTPDGVLNKATMNTLNRSAAEKADILRANIERLNKLSPMPDGRYVLVNIPSAELKVRQHGQTEWAARVVIGRPKRPTPTLVSQIESFIVNPEWHPPPTIIKEDIMPGLRNNPEYLVKKGIRVESDYGSDPYGRDLDWEQVSAGDVKFYQKSGRKNSLGILKFDFDNPYSIYIHGTPHQELFDRMDRAQSSGCIRVKEPQKLAEVLMQSASAAEDIEHRISTGKTQRVALPASVPVYVTYLTAFPDDNGVIQFRKDIYKRDADLIARLRTTPPAHAQVVAAK